ncbi:MAG TPA: phosphotransferase [Acidimicrobiales bacterium]|nr:phosphotransferase [Acidimicrobiales bacterium]
MLSTPTVEMLWEPVDPHEALASRFKFADAGQLAAWVTEVLTDTWGVEVISCDRVVISAGNALVWITTWTGRMILKCSVRPSLFARLANVARLTSWLDGRGLPVSAPLPALNGDLQVERNGFSMGLQSVVNGSMLDADNLAQVHVAGAELARLHLALAEYSDAGPLGPGGQADSTPLRTRVEGWLHSDAGDHVAPLAESLRRRLASLPDTTLPAPQLVHLDIRSANLLCAGDRISAILDFEDAGIDHPVDDLAKAVVLLGTRFRHWGPVPPETHATFVAGYRAVRELSSPEAAWLKPLILWRTLRLVPAGGDPTGWAESAERI